MGVSFAKENPESIRGAFAAIADRYDLANHVLSFGVDFVWRWLAARRVAKAAPGWVLDLATGSGDLAKAILRASPGAKVVGVDFCAPMLAEARRKGLAPLLCADGLALPFVDGTFDAVTVSFGLRNMASWPAALEEMARVLRPGGLLVVVDFSMPESRLWRAFYRAYLHGVLPRMAGLLTGKPDAYRYLADSIEEFPKGGAMISLIESSGFEEAVARQLPPGVAAMYSARRSKSRLPQLATAR